MCHRASFSCLLTVRFKHLHYKPHQAHLAQNTSSNSRGILSTAGSRRYLQIYSRDSCCEEQDGGGALSWLSSLRKAALLGAKMVRPRLGLGRLLAKPLMPSAEDRKKRSGWLASTPANVAVQPPLADALARGCVCSDAPGCWTPGNSGPGPPPVRKGGSGSATGSGGSSC